MINQQDKARIARENGAKSHGPKSPQGKQRSAQNATKHGIYSSRIVLNTESQEVYDLLYQRFHDLWQPANEFEHHVFLDMLHARWRIRRIETFETSLLDIACMETQQDVEEDYEAIDPISHQALAFNGMLNENPHTLTAIRRAEAHYHRIFDKSLRLLQDLRAKSGRPKIDPDAWPVESDLPDNFTPPPPFTAQPRSEAPSPPAPGRFLPILTLLLLLLLPAQTQAHQQNAGTNPWNRRFRLSSAAFACSALIFDGVRIARLATKADEIPAWAPCHRPAAYPDTGSGCPYTPSFSTERSSVFTVFREVSTSAQNAFV